MAQPDISQILAALAGQSNGTPQASTPQQTTTGQAPPPGYPPGMIPAQPPSAPPQATSYLPQPSNIGSLDLSSIKPVNSGSVSITDAIAKAKSIAADRGVSSADSRQTSVTLRDDTRLAGRGYQRSRSRSPSRRNSYGANPYRDERREDPRRGGFRRSPSPDRNFRGARDPPAGQRAGDGETETIRVKSALVGLIIGRNGENLRKVESETGARVQFIQAKDSHVAERQCTISGSLRARENAKTAIYTIIDENGGQNVMPDKGAYTAGMPGRAKVNLPALREGENSTQIMVPDKTVGLIIGRGGETIKDLQERSGCHVNIVGENKSVNGLRPVNLIGNERATAVAKDMILEIVESDVRGTGPNQTAPQRDRGFDKGTNRGGAVIGGSSSGGGGGGGGDGSANGGRDHIEKTIQVPSEAVGMIIGKGGETIKDMQKTTGCKINVNQPKTPDITRDIDLAGSARSMADAERIIWEKVETVRQRDAARGVTHASVRDVGQQYDGYSQQQQQHQSPSMATYAQYMAPSQQTAQVPAVADSSDPYAAYGGQAAWYAQWYAQQMAQLQQSGQQPAGGAPGTQ